MVELSKRHRLRRTCGAGGSIHARVAPRQHRCRDRAGGAADANITIPPVKPCLVWRRPSDQVLAQTESDEMR
jgi:hypothetical protein